MGRHSSLRCPFARDEPDFRGWEYRAARRETYTATLELLCSHYDGRILIETNHETLEPGLLIWAFPFYAFPCSLHSCSLSIFRRLRWW